MNKLLWASVFLCFVSSASLAAEPAGGASKGAEDTGWGNAGGVSAGTVTGIVVVTGAIIAAVASGGGGTSTTTSH